MFEHTDGLAVFLLNYNGKWKTLYESALVSERMFRYCKTKQPTKQTLIALAIVLGLSIEEIDCLLRKYGYCISKSLVNDMVVAWFVNSNIDTTKRVALLEKINITLYDMGFPLLMTREK